MVVEVIDQFDVDPDETKGHAPVAINPYRPVAFQFVFERVELEGRHVEVFRACCNVQQAENAA